MSETIQGFRNTFIKWKEALESKGLKVNLGKTRVMVSGGITKDGMSKSNAYPCWVCSLRVKANSVLCVQCNKWIHSKWTGVKSVTNKFPGNLTCRQCEWNIGEAVEQEEKLCDEVEKVREFTHHGDRVKDAGRCEAVVTARTICGWAKFMKCGELLHGWRPPHRLKGAVYKRYIRPTMLYGSEAYCLKETEMKMS